MKQSEINEAVDLIKAIVPSLVAIATQPGTDAGADLRRATGALVAQAADEIRAATVVSSLGDCFVYSLNAGATFDGFELARRGAIRRSVTPGAAAAIVLGSFIQFSLVWQAYLVAEMDLDSRDQVDSFKARLNAGFEAAEMAASDDGDHEAYRALVSVHAAAIRDLTARARPLPRMTSYAFPVRRPSLWLANRIYGDGGRADEVARENRVIHPAFMPAAGRALSA